MSKTISETLPLSEGGLGRTEIFWRENFHWFREQGYQLRNRYSPDWTPSWGTKSVNYWRKEDGVPLMHATVNDAIHIPTGEQVALKITRTQFNSNEIDIMQYLSSESISSDPQNHCVKLLDVLYPPGDSQKHIQILVMPLLHTFSAPKFDTIGEALEWSLITLQGLRFLHRHHIAHRDLNFQNFMMDWKGMFPDGFHTQEDEWNKTMTGPVRAFTRTQYPRRYFIIDFGMSSRYDPNDKSSRSEHCLIGGDKTVPEFLRGDEFHDPFKADIYYTGNLIRTEFMQGHPLLDEIQGYKSFGFMKPLIDDMVQDDPEKRPTMDEVIQRFDALVEGLSEWQLRARAAPRGINIFKETGHIISHWGRKIVFLIKRTPALPKPT
ncbi:hypothetical protein M413DRAFT_78958 [Hebeloma cylindrosporum]|uniref:Protein kinase domain-containing protein n=1 Tax=Hebeloma cylindrosporum TaxID=76867 RepID=A0A0C2XDB9_HEBCY|nr:hypothetical protein M413DRAFT_78958 [Hebeloma cylindrosporum h7]